MKRVLFVIIPSLFSLLVYSQEQYNDLFVAKSLIDRGFYGAAIEVIGNSPGLESDFRYSLLEGDALFCSGDYNKAISSYNNANALRAGSGELGLARVYAVLNNKVSSLYHLEQHLRSTFRLPQRDILTDSSLKTLEGSREWNALWKKEWYTQLEVGVAEVEYLVGRNRIDEASESAGSFASLYSDRPEVDYIRGILAIRKGSAADASRYFRQSLDKDGNVARVWEMYIESLAATGDYFSAANAASEAISVFPERLSLYILKVDNLRRAGDRESAMKDIITLVKYYPENEEVTRLAGIIAYETRNYSQALKYLSDNIERYPGVADHYNSRGDVYLVTKTWEFAIKDYSMALDLDPFNGDTYYKKASALIESGNVKDACHDLKMALKLGNRKASALISKLCIE